MKPLKPFGIFICALFLVSGLGMMIDVLLPNGPASKPTKATGQGAAERPETTTGAALAEESPSARTETDSMADIPVDSPTVYPTDVNPAAGSICHAALKQYLTYIDARAAYLLRAGAKQNDTGIFLKTRDEAVRGELAILAAKAGTFQGNPDHFDTLTTLAAERQAVAVAVQWHAADQSNQSRQEVAIYDVNLSC
ncbi:hypothetical protein N836_00280 [Leptolyngbya sp. Heron Island J]|uniref:hypothetical protein n=1 Tax=Leptolyngbya sp. Heron Island J TaxID=1385935 RepID=UPI0003B9DF18|nr:hypothetical protein [Leptolyngbya sp. Heron Island J]ESA37149.1 hypothetical protein N836_00280 [Leptolyngbya sp. Heron Island J]